MTQEALTQAVAIPEGILAAQALRLLDEVRERMDDDLDAARLSMSRLTVLLSARTEPAAETRRGGLAPWQKRRVEQYVRDNLDGPIRLDDMAAVVARSACYFSRAFKVTFGQTPHAYVMGQRVRRAQDMMLQTGESLSQIALACGFADQAHLSRLFRREVGATPSAWRRAAEAMPLAA